MVKILFICEGNVARSQMAEAIFSQTFQGHHVTTSAGTKVIKNGVSKEGQKIKDKDMNIVMVMKEVGMDVSNYVRKQVTPKMAEEADKIVVISPSQYIPDFIQESSKTVHWNVPDPFQQSLEFARDVRKRLQELIKDMAKNLK